MPLYVDQDEIQEVKSPEYAFPPIVGPQFCADTTIELIVLRTNTFSSGYGGSDLSVLDPAGNLHFSVHGRHTPGLRNKRILLNSSGIPLLCAQRKVLSLRNRWDVFRGEETVAANALFSVKRSAYFQLKTSLNVFLAANTREEKADFKLKGGCGGCVEKSCTIFHGSQPIAEAKHKSAGESTSRVGQESLTITMFAGTDYAFIVTLIIIMDEIQREHRATIIASQKEETQAL